MNATKVDDSLMSARVDSVLMWITIASGVLIFVVALLFACKYCSKIRRSEFNYDKEAAYLGKVTEARMNKRYSIVDDQDAIRRSQQHRNRDKNRNRKDHEKAMQQNRAQFVIPLVTITDYDAETEQRAARQHSPALSLIAESPPREYSPPLALSGSERDADFEVEVDVNEAEEYSCDEQSQHDSLANGNVNLDGNEFEEDSCRNCGAPNPQGAGTQQLVSHCCDRRPVA